MLKPLQDFSHFQRLIDNKKDFFVYKYNPNSCPLSDKTKPKVQEFLSQRTDVSGYIIDVIEQTELKVQIAEYIDIPHESPQILCFKSGEYTAHTSHMKIKESRLEDVYS